MPGCIPDGCSVEVCLNAGRISVGERGIQDRNAYNDQHLDIYNTPVIMVDSEGRLAGINSAMTSFLGKPREEILGLLGGELMGCRYAILAEGCGQTVYCSTCSIPQTVNKAKATGQDLLNVEACLDGENQRIHFLISAFNRGAFINVVIEKITGIEPFPA